MLPHSLRQIRNSQTQLCEQVRLDPNAHCVIARAKQSHLADAWDAIQRVVDIDVRVVREKQRVVRLSRRKDRDRKHRQACRLAHVQTEIVDIGRQIRLRLGHAVLHVDLIDVRVRIDVKRDGQCHGAVVRICRLHVEHVVDTAHLLFERSRNRLFDGHSIGAGVSRVNDDLRWHDVGKLGYGQAPHRNQAADYRDNGDYHSHDGPVYEEFRNH